MVSGFKEDGMGKLLPTKVDPKRTFKKARIPRELQLNDMELVVPLDPRVVAAMANFNPTNSIRRQARCTQNTGAIL